jgi:HlyD family secretion protein
LKTWKKVLIGLVVLVILGGGALWLLWPKSQATEGSTSLYQVKQGSISREISLSGNVALKSQINVTSGVSGKVAQIKVSVGDSVEEGQELVLLDTSDLDSQIQDAQWNLESAQLRLQQLLEPLSEYDQESLKISLEKAQIELESAQANLEQTTETCSMSERLARDSISQAQADLEDAKENLQLVKQNAERALASIQKEIQKAQEQLDNATTEAERETAQEALDSAKEKLENQKLTNEQQISQAQKQVQSAENALTKAELSLKQTLMSNENSLRNAQNQLTSAQYSLKLAQLQYEQKMSSTSTVDLRIQEMTVEQAQTKLNQLLSQKNSSSVKAPSPGTVSAINVKVGDAVGASTALIVLTNPDALEVTCNVPEVSVGEIQVGMEARVTADAFPGETFKATLSAIDPVATETQGVVSYGAHFSLEEKAFSNLKPGMTVQVKVVVAQAKNAIIIPRTALQSTGKNYLVKVWDGAQFKVQAVEVGILNDTFAEIKSGLNPGDQVALSFEGSSSTRTQVQTTPGGMPIGPGGFEGVPVAPGGERRVP